MGQITVKKNHSSKVFTKKEKSFTGIVEEVNVLLDNLGSEYRDELLKIRELKERFLNERFHLAVLGQFKRGKSTLLNALLGDEILPASVVPLTAIPTYLIWGPEYKARVYFQDGKTEESKSKDNLVQYVTETNNPENRKGVSHVEVFFPSAILSKGVVLIDTPGIGSTYKHNTEVTFDFLPRCDAALFLVSADPPVTEVEINFLKAVQKRVARIIFVLNKVDYLSENEKDTLEKFFKNVLRKDAGATEDIVLFSVSAQQGLTAKKTDSEKLWVTSGMKSLYSHLTDFLAREKSHVLKEALIMKMDDIIGNIILQLQLTVNSLQTPLTELEKRITVFEEKFNEAKEQQRTLEDLLNGERRRLMEYLETQAESLRQEAKAYLEEVAMSSFTDNKLVEEKVQDTVADAIPDFFEPKLNEMSRLFNERVLEIFQAYEQRAVELIDTVRQNAAELFAVPYSSSEKADIFVMKHQPYWKTHKWESSLIFLPTGLVEVLLPAEIRKKRAEKKIKEQIEDLVRFNVENLRWATLQNLDQAIRKLKANLDERLHWTAGTIIQVMQSARAKQLEQGHHVDAEVTKLRQVMAELVIIREDLKKL